MYIGSMESIGVQNVHFARKAVVHLVDMMNDDSDAVRIKSIQTLSSIYAQYCDAVDMGLKFEADQLKALLIAADDPLEAIREHCYGIFENLKTDDCTLLQSTVIALIDNAVKYGDVQMMLRLMERMGRRNPKCIALAVESLLRLDDRFVPTGFDLNSIKCKCAVITIIHVYVCFIDIGLHVLTFNAIKAMNGEEIISKLPPIYFEHLALLRLKYPQHYGNSSSMYKNSNNTHKRTLQRLFEETRQLRRQKVFQPHVAKRLNSTALYYLYAFTGHTDSLMRMLKECSEQTERYNTTFSPMDDSADSDDVTIDCDGLTALCPSITVQPHLPSRSSAGSSETNPFIWPTAAVDLKLLVTGRLIPNNETVPWDKMLIKAECDKTIEDTQYYFEMMNITTTRDNTWILVLQLPAATKCSNWRLSVVRRKDNEKEIEITKEPAYFYTTISR